MIPKPKWTECHILVFVLCPETWLGIRGLPVGNEVLVKDDQDHRNYYLYFTCTGIGRETNNIRYYRRGDDVVISKNGRVRAIASGVMAEEGQVFDKMSAFPDVQIPKVVVAKDPTVNGQKNWEPLIVMSPWVVFRHMINEQHNSECPAS